MLDGVQASVLVQVLEGPQEGRPKISVVSLEHEIKQVIFHGLKQVDDLDTFVNNILVQVMGRACQLSDHLERLSDKVTR